MLKILATGISGSEREDYLNAVRDYAANLQPPKKIEVMSVGQRMHDKSEKLGLKFDPEKILDAAPAHLTALRAAVFEEILGYVEQEKKNAMGEKIECLIISTHACFRWKKHLMPAFDVHYLGSLQPDLYVTIVEDVARIKARQELTNQWKGRLTLKENLIWRDEEVFLTKILADYQTKKHYIISRRQDPGVLYDLIFKAEQMKKAYLSYPMTSVKRNRKLYAEKNELRSMLRKDLVVFDPDEFEDTDLLLYAQDGSDVIDAPIDGMKCSFLKRDAEECLPIIKDLTVSRDFRLIEQADLVIVYWPEVEKRLPATTGVVVEAYYGYTNNKYVYAYYPSEESPFLLYFARSSRTLKGLLEMLRQMGYLRNNTAP